MKNMLQDKVILITGSSHELGIGAATARLAKAYGATVILHGRTESEELKKLAQELESKYIVCDASDKNGAQEASVQVLQKVNKIDGLINCLGMVNPKAFLESVDNDWIAEYKTNLLGIVHFCQIIIPYMQYKGGSIVNVASMRGDASLASARAMSYSVTKAGVINLTTALAKEYAPNIRVNAVSPGFVETDMSKTWNDLVWKQTKESLLARTGKPNEIAEVLLFLISDKASFMTGQNILVDGGYSVFGK